MPDPTPNATREAVRPWMDEVAAKVAERFAHAVTTHTVIRCYVVTQLVRFAPATPAATVPTSGDGGVQPLREALRALVESVNRHDHPWAHEPALDNAVKLLAAGATNEA